VTEGADVDRVNKALLNEKQRPSFESPEVTLEMLLAEGKRLVEEQDLIMQQKLSEEYMKGIKDQPQGPSLIGFGS
jgi:hypothetical protein